MGITIEKIAYIDTERKGKDKGKLTEIDFTGQDIDTVAVQVEGLLGQMAAAKAAAGEVMPVVKVRKEKGPKEEEDGQRSAWDTVISYPKEEIKNK